MTSIRGSGSIVRWISEPAIQEETAEKLGVSVIEGATNHDGAIESG